MVFYFSEALGSQKKLIVYFSVLPYNGGGGGSQPSRSADWFMFDSLMISLTWSGWHWWMEYLGLRISQRAHLRRRSCGGKNTNVLFSSWNRRRLVPQHDYLTYFASVQSWATHTWMLNQNYSINFFLKKFKNFSQPECHRHIVPSCKSLAPQQLVHQCRRILDETLRAQNCSWKIYFQQTTHLCWIVQGRSVAGCFHWSCDTPNWLLIMFTLGLELCKQLRYFISHL